MNAWSSTWCCLRWWTLVDDGPRKSSMAKRMTRKLFVSRAFQEVRVDACLHGARLLLRHPSPVTQVLGHPFESCGLHESQVRHLRDWERRLAVRVSVGFARKHRVRLAMTMELNFPAGITYLREGISITDRGLSSTPAGKDCRRKGVKGWIC